jgi:CBS domain-containing protein
MPPGARCRYDSSVELAEIMTTNFAVVAPEATIADASRRMLEIDTGAAVVLADGELAGVISERDLLRAVRDGAASDEAVADRMTRHVMTAAPSTGLPEAMAIMVDGHFRHLPIVDSGRVVGMVSMRDLMAWASLRLRHGSALDAEDDVDTVELIATIHRMRTGAA